MELQRAILSSLLEGCTPEGSAVFVLDTRLRGQCPRKAPPLGQDFSHLLERERLQCREEKVMQSSGRDHMQARDRQASLRHVNCGASSSGVPQALSSVLRA